MSDSSRKVDLVLDTNVLLELFSIHDLAQVMERSASDDDAEVQYRRGRARDALLAACTFDRDVLATGSLLNEPLRKLQALVPPADETGPLATSTRSTTGN